MTLPIYNLDLFFFAFNFQNLIIGVIFNISFIEYYYRLDFLNFSLRRSAENEKRLLKSRKFVFNFFHATFLSSKMQNRSLNVISYYIIKFINFIYNYHQINKFNSET